MNRVRPASAPRGERRLVGAAPAVCLLLVLLVGATGCVRLPTTGRVVAGEEIEADSQRMPLRVVVRGPREGAEPVEIVEGFLTAAGTLEDFETAREFLTPQAQDRWRPNAETRIHVGAADVAVDEPDGGSVQVSIGADLVARVDSSGRYREEPGAVEHADELQLDQVDGAWRISALPPGVLVRELDADRVLEAYPVYFVDPAADYLVPDVRWFPRRPSSAVAMVRALLEGPSTPLLQSVRSGAPPGTRLEVNSVPVEDGVATVELTEDVLEASPEERALLQLQVQESVRQLPGVAAARLTVDGRALELPAPDDAAASVPVLADPSVGPAVDPRPVALADPASVAGTGPEPGDDASEPAAAQDDPVGSDPPAAPEQRPGRPLAPEGAVVARLDASGLVAVDGLEELAAQVRTGLAVGRDGSRYAGLDGARGTLVVQTPGLPATTVLQGTALTTPSIDRWGWVWTVSHPDGQPPLVQAHLSGQSPVQVAVSDVEPGDRVRALRVSREGARVLVVLERSSGEVTTAVAGVVRNASGRPSQLSVARTPVAIGLTDAVEAAWVGADEVVVLGRRSPSEELRPVLAQVGGPSEALAATPSAVSVTSGEGERRIVVGTSGGVLLTRSGSQWVDAAPGASPAFEG